MKHLSIVLLILTSFSCENVRHKSSFMNEKIISSELENENCPDWNPKKDQILDVIHKMKLQEHGAVQVEDLFYHRKKCRIRGELLIDSMRLKYYLYATGYISLSNKDTSFFLGCESKDCEDFFLSIRISDDELKDMYK